jgi:hypothetical protein
MTFTSASTSGSFARFACVRHALMNQSVRVRPGQAVAQFGGELEQATFLQFGPVPACQAAAASKD